MLRLTTLALGHCTVLAASAGLAGRGRIELPALATLIETGDACILVDTGYGAAFLSATARFPERLYRWATPVTLPAAPLPDLLPRPPDLVLLTHMHGDHVAGLMDLPRDVPVLASRAAIAHLRGLADWAATRAACPAGLRDGVLARVLSPVEACPRVATGLPGFPEGHDLLGDGCLIAVPLPGHGVGQTGLWVPEAARLLVADAAYARAALRAGRMPPRWLLRRLGDADAYARTFDALRALMQARPEIRIDPSHCRETAA
ncbi:glyoxylase-like metal-dependent hydrolase (beta-lactamase superfamily II) [Hasllibacter halocynthiae]|uniref:Glyoxylase-like metal-dependent hydrolase (Beta-lactamase superfamily II) n=1 Tax=Hasllibacter halocynthiae TaxID=595589 RepID=A0A2T0WZE7_9RHOB|nr:MBL fold metallo-hydrolase [Hasllibacter halocynthiae]PRY92060.1 glyoxylase-like metal-dependent hydrolase (beta-lactamase superfamily II) [Hasllibacter halocynthiae]